MRAVAALLAALLVAAACGGDEPDDAAPSDDPSAATDAASSDEPAAASDAASSDEPADEVALGGWAALGTVVPQTTPVLHLVDVARVQELIGPYPGGELTDPAVGAWFVRAREEVGASTFSGHLAEAWNRLDPDLWDLFLGRSFGDLHLTMVGAGPGETSTTMRFATADVGAVLVAAGWQAVADNWYGTAESDITATVDDQTVLFMLAADDAGGDEATTANVVADVAGVPELLAALDASGVHEGLLGLEPVTLTEVDDPLPIRLADAAGVRSAGASLEAVTMAVYAQESDAQAAADGIAQRIQAMGPDDDYADSTVSATGRVVTVVTPSASDPLLWNKAYILGLVNVLFS